MVCCEVLWNAIRYYMDQYNFCLLFLGAVECQYEMHGLLFWCYDRPWCWGFIWSATAWCHIARWGCCPWNTCCSKAMGSSIYRKALNKKALPIVRHDENLIHIRPIIVNEMPSYHPPTPWKTSIIHNYLSSESKFFKISDFMVTENYYYKGVICGAVSSIINCMRLENSVAASHWLHISLTLAAH